MRTTLTLDDDVAAALEKLRRTRKGGYKALVNDVLREGLKHMRARPVRRESFQTQGVDLGRARIGSIDNIGDALAIAESESYK